MAKVQLRRNESLESLLRRFKRAVANDGILLDLRKHEYYMKPSEARRKKSLMAQRRRERALMEVDE